MSSSDSPVSSKTGALLVISGPSGTGKTSICKGVLERVPEAVWSVSITTRRPRGTERPGDSYEFVSADEFQRRHDAGDLLESAEYVGNRYGTPRAPVVTALTQGKVVVMEIDVQGAIQVAERMPDAICIFVMPPNRESLRARLEGRNTEAEEQLRRRLAEADGEIAVARDSGCYQHFVVNDILEDTIDAVIDIINEHRSAK